MAADAPVAPSMAADAPVAPSMAADAPIAAAAAAASSSAWLDFLGDLICDDDDGWEEMWVC